MLTESHTQLEASLSEKTKAFDKLYSDFESCMEDLRIERNSAKELKKQISILETVKTEKKVVSSSKTKEQA